MRSDPTPAEEILWKHLRRGQLDGLRFRRQQPVGGFILDFYCSVARIGIECDGAVHDETEHAAYDQWRQRLLESEGIRILRFADAKVYDALGDVLEEIRAACSGHLR